MEQQQQQQQQQHATQADLVRALESIDHHGINYDLVVGHHPTLHHQLDFTTPQPQSQPEPTPAALTPSNAAGSEHVETEKISDLQEWTREQLQAEILKLRAAATANATMTVSASTPIPAATAPVGHTHTHTHTQPTQPFHPSLQDTSVGDNTTAALAAAIVRAGTLHTPTASTSSSSRKRGRKAKPPQEDAADATVSGTVKKAKTQSARRDDTGKRLGKERRTELSKIARSKMRSMLGIGPTDPLPHPYNSLDPSLTSVQPDLPFIPNWQQMFEDEANVAWVAKICAEIMQEGAAGQHYKLSPDDLEPEVVNTTTRTAFQNLCKRYMTDIHPKGAERRAKYIKRRRRWARKDLKQARRSRSAADPSFADLHIPPSALHLDYMSSEYSSAGEDDEAEEVSQEVILGRKGKWQAMLGEAAMQNTSKVDSGKGGWAVGLGEKVLEVRTPRWRSEQLNDIYRRLDAFANEQADHRANSNTNPKSTPSLAPSLSAATSKPLPRAGHVAPSHRRFTLSPSLMRKGNKPRDEGEEWMWATAQKGVWPALPSGVSELEQQQQQQGPTPVFEQGETSQNPSGSNLAQVLVLEHEHEHGRNVNDDDVQLQQNRTDGAAAGAGAGDGDAEAWETAMNMDLGDAERLDLVSALEGMP